MIDLSDVRELYRYDRWANTRAFEAVSAFSQEEFASVGWTLEQRDEARMILQELTQQSQQRRVSPYDMAILHLGLGETEEAFAWLEKSHAQRERWMLQLKVAPFLDPLRCDPRFTDLMRRVGVWP